MTSERLAEEMLLLQKRGCHNINWVTPTHYVPQILKALFMLLQKGCTYPLYTIVADTNLSIPSLFLTALWISISRILNMRTIEGPRPFHLP